MIDQETVLNWFGVENPNFNSSGPISMETLNLIVEGLWQRVQNGLTLGDIESIIFIMLFLRFLILAVRFNLKTSFYITCIGLFAGYLWYRHLIDLIVLYRQVLIQLPYLNKLGMDGFELLDLSEELLMTQISLKENVPWYDPGKLIYYAFTNGIVKLDPKSGLGYYIDPISMAISNLSEPTKSKILPIYYNIYNRFIPLIFGTIATTWRQLSGLAAYAVITRMGKRYCPYLVRWHWTFLLILGFVEQIIISFFFRVVYFQEYVLLPQADALMGAPIILEIKVLNVITTLIVFLHLGFIFFGMFHAIWGQYFYFPFLVENTELHIGPRPKNSVYSGGNTAWQDEKQKNPKRLLPKFWYGWFGSGTNKDWNIFKLFTNFLAKKIKND